MIDATLQALWLIIQPERLAFLFLGVGIGIVIGILPALGGATGMALLLPFVFGMDPISGLALLMGMAAVTQTSDTFPSVLMGIPGSGSSQATIMDGFPMAKRGEGARALGASFSASMIGGLVGAVALFGGVLVARPLVLAMGSPELFMVTMLGLSMVGILSFGKPLAGLAMGAFGLLLGSIGGAPTAGVYRFTFDQLYLYDGLPVIVVALGFFAFPELVDLIIKREPIAGKFKLGAGVLAGARETLKHKSLVFRSSIIGFAIGVIPGLGGPVADWVTYGLAAQTSRNKDRFGKGDIRGVIAPESANNAKDGGGLIPTLLFGIPAGATTAILLGGLVLMGVQPGPKMVEDDLPILMSTVWTLALANVLATGVCMVLARYIARLTMIPAVRLVPFMIVILAVASYQASQQWSDIVLLVVLGLIGWLMKQVGWPRAPVLIGFVLSGSAERYLFVSMDRYGYSWLLHPGVIGLSIVMIALLFLGMRANRARSDGAVSYSM